MINTSIKKIVKHLLKVDIRTRGNDTLLQIRSLESQGLAKRMERTRFGTGWFIKESDILSGKISRSFNESVRRCRQKVQEYGEFLPPDTILEERRSAQEKMRHNHTLFPEYDKNQSILIDQEGN